MNPLETQSKVEQPTDNAFNVLNQDLKRTLLHQLLAADTSDAIRLSSVSKEMRSLYNEINLDDIKLAHAIQSGDCDAEAHRTHPTPFVRYASQGYSQRFNAFKARFNLTSSDLSPIINQHNHPDRPYAKTLLLEMTHPPYDIITRTEALYDLNEVSPLSTRMIDTLILHTRDATDSFLKFAACAILISITPTNERITQAYIHIIQHESDLFVKRLAIHGLADPTITDPVVMDTLITTLSDPNIGIQIPCIQALSHVHPSLRTTALRHLEQFAQDNTNADLQNILNFAINELNHLI